MPDWVALFGWGERNNLPFNINNIATLFRVVMEKGIIYCAHCVFNGKKYLGQTKRTLNFRIKKHFYDTKKYQGKFQNALIKYKENGFIWGIVEECSYENLTERELYWINFYNSYYDGYNSTHGGEGGFVTHCRKFKLMSPFGDINESENVMKFCREHNLSHSEIINVLNGHTKSHKGWKLPETQFTGNEAKIQSKIKEFILISPDGKLVQGKNRAQFCRENGLSPGNLSMLINGKPKYKSVKGWKLLIE